MCAPDLQSCIAAIASLDEPVRRELYLYVAGRGREVGRDEAARALRISRALAAFHLDKLVELGLLDAAYRRLSGRKALARAVRPSCTGAPRGSSKSLSPDVATTSPGGCWPARSPRNAPRPAVGSSSAPRTTSERRSVGKREAKGAAAAAAGGRGGGSRSRPRWPHSTTAASSRRAWMAKCGCAIARSTRSRPRRASSCAG